MTFRFTDLHELNYLKSDPLDELADILFSFMDEGVIKRIALRGFSDNKPRVKEIIKANRSKLIELIEAI